MLSSPLCALVVATEEVSYVHFIENRFLFFAMFVVICSFSSCLFLSICKIINREWLIHRLYSFWVVCVKEDSEEG